MVIPVTSVARNNPGIISSVRATFPPRVEKPPRKYKFMAEVEVVVPEEESALSVLQIMLSATTKLPIGVYDTDERNEVEVCGEIRVASPVTLVSLAVRDE